jgi:hypothetical protein
VVDILLFELLTSWAKKKFVIACVTVLLKGVLGILSSTVFNWIMEGLMKLPTGKLGVFGGLAVLWGPSLLPFTETVRIGRGELLPETPRRFEAFPPHQLHATP